MEQLTSPRIYIACARANLYVTERKTLIWPPEGSLIKLL